MKGELLKRLMAKLEGYAPKMRAASLGGDEGMAGAASMGKKFRTGAKGPDNVSAGGARGYTPPMSESTALELGQPAGGALGADMQTMRPFNSMDELKRRLANLTPEQKAAILAGSGGLATGGLGGYMLGDEEEQ